jgi:hypothetical protein
VIQSHQLQKLIDDPSSTSEEIAKAKLALDKLNAKPSQRRVPSTQADEDTDIENWYRPDGHLTRSDIIAITRGLPQSTQDCIDAIDNTRLLWLFVPEYLPTLLDLARRTQSEIVRTKVLEAITFTAKCSPNENRHEAQEYLHQLTPTTNEEQ